MNRLLLLLTLLCLTVPLQPASAQGGSRIGTFSRLRRLSEKSVDRDAKEMKDRLSQANTQADRERPAPPTASEQAANEEMLARTTAATTVTSPEDSLTPGERQARIDGQAAMTAARNNLTPIARAVLDSAANPAPTTAKPTLVIAQNTTSEPAITPTSPNPPSTDAPKPKPLKPASLEPERPEGEVIVITAQENFSDFSKGIGIFAGNVHVESSTFRIDGEDMEIHMKPQAPATTDGEPAPATSSQPEIDFIIIRGPTVVIEKKTTDGTVTVGKCQKAVFDGATQELLLSIWPQVQQGNQVQIATDADTTMTIFPNNTFKSHGSTRTDIIRPKEEDKQNSTNQLQPSSQQGQ